MHTHEKPHLNETSKLTLNKLYILVIMTSLFYSRTLLYNTPPSPSLPIQVVNAISIFGNDKRGACRLPTGHCKVSATFIL